EVNVECAALGAYYGRVAGGVVQAITRPGGNEVHGSAFLDWMPIELPRRTLRYNLAGGAELGGPLARNSLWFYGGFAPVLMATRSGVLTEYQYIGKLTWRPVRNLFLDGGVRLERDDLIGKTDFLPRVGVAWDFSGRGVSRAYAFVGRFFESPELASQRRTREHQLAAGVQSQIFRDVVAGLDYVHKDFRDAPDGRTSYDGATLSLAKPFSASSLLQASYTLSSLDGPRTLAADAPNVIKLD